MVYGLSEMPRLCWARVHAFSDNRELAAEFYVAESKARAAKCGILPNALYTVRIVESVALANDVGSFQLAEAF
jgi:hypothetical protein